jgi:hypothetical protein
VTTLKNEVSSLKTELTEITSLLKRLVLDNNKATAPNLLADMTLAPKWPNQYNNETDYSLEYQKQIKTNKDKQARQRSSHHKRQGKHDKILIIVV